MPIKKELLYFYRGPAWEATRSRIRERAGDRCERCKARNGDRVLRWKPEHATLKRLVDGYRITIQCGCAHLNNVAGDDRDENLAWLCRGCHLNHDKPFHRESRATRKDAARPLLAGLAQWTDLSPREYGPEERPVPRELSA